MRMIGMGLNLTICTREEKEAKRDALLDYLIKHVKVISSVDISKTFC